MGTGEAPKRVGRVSDDAYFLYILTYYFVLSLLDMSSRTYVYNVILATSGNHFSHPHQLPES